METFVCNMTTEFVFVSYNFFATQLLWHLTRYLCRKKEFTLMAYFLFRPNYNIGVLGTSMLYNVGNSILAFTPQVCSVDHFHVYAGNGRRRLVSFPFLFVWLQ